MKLIDLIAKVKTSNEVIFGANFLGEILITDIALDSRLVKENSVFFAQKGSAVDGNIFIDESIKKGACAIVSSDLEFLKKTAQNLQNEKVLLIFSSHLSQLLVEFLQLFYPKLPNNVYAITGTNGKTSVAEFCRQIFEIFGQKSASIGTLGVNCDHLSQNQVQQTVLTTPDIVSFYKNLALLKKSEVENVIVEVSSIGLDQERIAGVSINVGAFTNFSQDHLDYHKTMEQYFACKMILFNSVLHEKDVAILNSDIAEYEKIAAICQNRNLEIISYGFAANSENSLKLQKIEKTTDGQRVFFSYLNEEYSFELMISGDFQAYNVICALAIFLTKNQLTKQELTNLLKKFYLLHTAVGRMQIAAKLLNKAQIFIDFAHTPDALTNVLQLGRKITKNKVIILFGCGGNRDNKKRPIMGQIASKLADYVIITDDNPRLENAASIRAEILQGCDMTKTIEIADRKMAIQKAITMLQEFDILILAGKGHEKYQVIGNQKLEFDEEKIVKELLAR